MRAPYSPSALLILLTLTGCSESASQYSEHKRVEDSLGKDAQRLEQRVDKLEMRIRELEQKLK